jgi:hypothetical protein
MSTRVKIAHNAIASRSDNLAILRNHGSEWTACFVDNTRLAHQSNGFSHQALILF